MVIDFMEMLKSIVSCSNVSLTVIKPGENIAPDFDLGLRKTLLGEEEKENFLQLAYQRGKEGVIYYVEDYFDVEYCIMRIPESEAEYGDFIIMGPYRASILSEVELETLIEVRQIPRDLSSELKEYYNAVPVLSDIEQWREICISVAQILYRENKKIQTEYVAQTSVSSRFREDIPKDILSFKMIEERYAIEAEVLSAIGNGNTEEALKLFQKLRKFKIASRYKNPVRNVRNGIIILNSLWRKAAEIGGVHPAYIDELSTKIAKSVENVNTSQEANRFMAEMLRKYCMLVRNYSLRGCSPVIQKVVNHINLSLSEELSLRQLSVEYSVNASYLSTLFKKEMNMTVTDYINQQRIHRAIRLLNSTNLSIQDVAAECGIYDVSYFRKLFKKITGKTPTEYVKEINSVQ